nr:reverse transcriptase domain-containing protein [Tanacetum cinerariifolium]
MKRHARRTQYHIPAKDVCERTDPSGFPGRDTRRKFARRFSGGNSLRAMDTLYGWIVMSLNNESEYEVLIAGLRIAAQMGVCNVHVKSLVSDFANFSINQVPRSKNKKADDLSKIASTSFAHLSKQVLVEILKEKSIQEKEVTTVVEEDRPTWMTPIIEYLKEETLPGYRKEASKLHIKARQYELSEGVLYRRSFHTPWLRCVGPL